MDYQGQNVNPNLTPDMGQNVAAPNNLETPDLPHDIQGMGAIGSSAANAEIEQMMSGDMVGQEKNREDGTIDLLSEMPPLSPTEMAETAAASSRSRFASASLRTLRGRVISSPRGG